MENSGQLFSLWVGKNSQELAHHFYALQAEQFFDESEDPTEHNCIWKLYDIHGQRKKPYFVTFDTEIPHLSYLRHTNHAKLLAQMKKSSKNDMQHYYFPMQHKTNEDTQVMEQKDKYLYQRWQASQSNYAIIDKNFIQDCDSFEYWKDIYKANSQIYQDKVRKNFEALDYLKNITFTSDLERSGFSQQLLLYLKDECPKKDIFFFQLQNTQKGGFYEVSQLQSFAEIATLSQTFLSLKAQIPYFQYFQAQNPFIHMAPLMNCLLTPLSLKNQTKENYMSNILTNPHRNIFDLAYTMPIIDHELYLAKRTNIFDFLLENKHEKFFQTQEAIRTNPKNQNQNDIQKQQMLHLLQEDSQNRINYGADYLGLRKQAKQKPHHKIESELYTGLLSEAYVLKGHIKGFQNIFSPNCQLLDLKYLQGILCNYTGNQAKYNKNYVKAYGQSVVNYPFHCVMFQHKNFGDHLRKIAEYKNKKIRHQLQGQWKQDILCQADFYKEMIAQDDD